MNPLTAAIICVAAGLAVSGWAPFALHPATPTTIYEVAR
jgi:transketolase C-terminal domain/subunit